MYHPGESALSSRGSAPLHGLGDLVLQLPHRRVCHVAEHLARNGSHTSFLSEMSIFVTFVEFF